MDLFQYGKFISHAGNELNWKIEMDAVSPAEWKCFAEMIMEYEKNPFCRVEGIPRGGLPLAKELEKYATGNDSHQVMIVDDVYTTGASFREYIDEKYPLWLRAMGIKWVVFARKPSKEDGVNALFTMPSNL